MKAKFFLLVPTLALLLTACKHEPYEPSTLLDEAQQTRLVRAMVYYSTKLPPNATEADKFDSVYNWYYDRAAAETKLLKLHPASEPDQLYFFISRVARSLKPMQEGIAGKIKMNPNGSLSEYEEIFRVWKMPAETLKVRGSMLFDRMVRGKDLSIFYPKYQGDKFIELPTDGYYFDKQSKRWKSSPPF